jgi:hypothetical protein
MISIQTIFDTLYHQVKQLADDEGISIRNYATSILPIKVEGKTTAWRFKLKMTIPPGLSKNGDEITATRECSLAELKAMGIRFKDWD